MLWRGFKQGGFALLGIALTHAEEGEKCCCAQKKHHCQAAKTEREQYHRRQHNRIQIRLGHTEQSLYPASIGALQVHG